MTSFILSTYALAGLVYAAWVLDTIVSASRAKDPEAHPLQSVADLGADHPLSPDVLRRMVFVATAAHLVLSVLLWPVLVGAEIVSAFRLWRLRRKLRRMLRNTRMTPEDHETFGAVIEHFKKR